MQYVYIIQSIDTKRLYFGRTDNLEKRLEAHNQGKNSSTSKCRPWEYVYIEGYKDKRDAVTRELQLKQYGNARTYIKKRLKHCIQ